MKPLFPLITVMVLLAVLVFGYVVNADRTSTAAPSEDPRSGDLRLVEPNPKAGIDDFSSFGWSYELPPGGYYRLSITDLESGQLVVDSLRTDLPDFRPSIEQLEKIGESIEVHVAAYSRDGPNPLSQTRRSLKIGEQP